MIIIAGELHVEPEARDAYLAAVADVTDEARRAAGCLDFVQAPDLLDSSRINVYERWESDEQLMSFRTGGDSTDDDVSTDVAVAELTSADVRKYRISAVEDP